MRTLEKTLMNEGTEIWRTGSGKWWLLGTVMMEPVSPMLDSKEKAVDYGIKSGRFSPAIRDRLLADKGEDGIGGPETFKQDESAGVPPAEETYGKIKDFGVMALKGYARRIGMPTDAVGGIRNAEGGVDEIMGHLYGDDWMKELMAKGAFKECAGMARLSRVVEGDDVLATRRIEIAVKTLKMPDAMAAVMGGMKKPQARLVLKAAGWSDEKISDLEGKKEGAWPLMSEPSR